MLKLLKKQRLMDEQRNYAMENMNFVGNYPWKLDGNLNDKIKYHFSKLQWHITGLFLKYLEVLKIIFGHLTK